MYTRMLNKKSEEKSNLLSVLVIYGVQKRDLFYLFSEGKGEC